MSVLANVHSWKWWPLEFTKVIDGDHFVMLYVHGCLHLTAESVVACCAYEPSFLYVRMCVRMYVCSHYCWYCVQVWLWTTRTWRALTRSMLRICRFVCTYVCMYIQMFICAHTHTSVSTVLYYIHDDDSSFFIYCGHDDICQLSSLG